MTEIDIAACRQDLERVAAVAEALGAALLGPEGRKISKRKLKQRAIEIVRAQLTLAVGASACLDALEQARATIERQRSDKSAAGMH